MPHTVLPIQPPSRDLHYNTALEALTRIKFTGLLDVGAAAPERARVPEEGMGGMMAGAALPRKSHRDNPALQRQKKE